MWGASDILWSEDGKKGELGILSKIKQKIVFQKSNKMKVHSLKARHSLKIEKI